jgi:hypothetical protein
MNVKQIIVLFVGGRSHQRRALGTRRAPCTAEQFPETAPPILPPAINPLTANS